MKIEVFSVGCAKCRLIEVAVYTALEELGLPTDIDKLQDPAEAQRRGVMSQPALFINGKLIVQGRYPSVGEVKDMINRERGLINDISAY